MHISYIFFDLHPFLLTFFYPTIGPQFGFISVYSSSPQHFHLSPTPVSIHKITSTWAGSLGIRFRSHQSRLQPYTFVHTDYMTVLIATTSSCFFFSPLTHTNICLFVSGLPVHCPHSLLEDKDAKNTLPLWSWSLSTPHFQHWVPWRHSLFSNLFMAWRHPTSLP